MSRLNITDRKKYFFDILSPYFGKLGFNEFLSENHPSFVSNEGQKVIHFGFNFFSNDTILCGPLCLTYYDVEQYILDIGIPTNKFEKQKKRKNEHLPTISQREIPEELKPLQLNTINEIESFAKNYIKHYNNKGVSFIEKYASLPEIVKELNTIGIDNWKDLIPGMGEVYIRGLIMLKFCDAPLFNENFNKVNQMIQGVDGWLPYWEKYKKVLREIEPKYNL